MNTNSSLFSNGSKCGAARVKALSHRQVQVLTLVAEGATDGEIARQLGLSSKTIAYYVKQIRDRLDARSRAHAVALALRQDLLPAKLSGSEPP